MGNDQCHESLRDIVMYPIDFNCKRKVLVSLSCYLEKKKENEENIDENLNNNTRVIFFSLV